LSPPGDSTSPDRRRLESTETSRLTHLPGHLKRVGYLMDESIRLPGGFRIGWDPIIGLIPGFGDLVGITVSSYVALSAARAGASIAVLGRMLVNLALEIVVGSIPLVGDLFDGVFKANVRNLRLMDAHLASPQTAKRRSVVWLTTLLVLIIVVAVVLMIAVIAVLVWTWRTLAGLAGG
jgi:hypothetical protein